MQSRATTGQAYRNGALLATEIVLTERAELRATAVPIPGSRQQHFRQDIIALPSTIRFVQVDDPILGDELIKLIKGAGNIDLRRAQRDEGWEPAPLDLVVEFERNLLGCRFSHPLFGHSAIEATDFSIHLPAD